MNWKKKGLVFVPDKKLWWRHLYAMVPTPEYLKEENRIRIYYGTTDIEKFGRTSYIEVDADNPIIIKYVCDDYILDIGSNGLFDDSGAIPSSIITVNNKKYLYYIGFQRCVKVPYMLFSGLAVYNGSAFEKHSASPILDRIKAGPISNAAPFVIFDDNIYKMWFWIGKEWTILNNKYYVKAEVCYAESKDAINWDINPVSCIKLDETNEFSLGRPFVLKEDNIYKMWYSVRQIEKLYRIGYAESKDGINWIRKDEEVGIDISETGWDSEMICYPSVIKVKGKTYMFYNGNNNGETGFGVAELINE
jgi:predicted GH43/DUF377 family glycosyl hydrolase